MAKSAQITSQTASAPLWLLVRVNVLQLWRRLLAIRHQSRLLTTVISAFIFVYLAVSFGLFYKALQFVTRFPGLGSALTERLLYLLFAFLFWLLLLSNLIISYTNLFKNREASFLFSLPVPSQTIFRWKFIESSVLASWAFLFLIAPMLVAFGIVRGVPWHFYAVTLVLVMLFIVLPGVAGAWAAMQVARYLERRTFQAAVVGLAVVFLVATALWWRTAPATDEYAETRTIELLDQLLVKTRFSLFPFMPGYWISASVLQWADGALRGAALFVFVLLSYALFFGFIAFTGWGRLYYDTANQVQGRSNVLEQWGWVRARRERRREEVGARSRVERLLGWMGRDTRALVMKDLRMFWRDTSQWGQTVLLFGLLGAYIINLRNFTHELTSHFWINLVAYLNLGACSLNLATVTTRFVFPQFSLEGRRLWIVGMAPMGLVRVVRVKYWLASLMALSVTLGLVTVSCYLLKMPWTRIAFFGAVMTVMTFALNGLALGVGVLYPNFKDANPSKIVSGFGGTLCLVLSFLYILLSELALAFGANLFRRNPTLETASVIFFLVLSVIIGVVPMRLARRHLRDLEV